MAAPKIQFLAFDGCPLANAARRALEEALAELNMGDYETVDLLDADTSEELRGWGSPTILVNGKDVAGAVRGDSVGCRIYVARDGVPAAEAIVAVIRDEWVQG